MNEQEQWLQERANAKPVLDATEQAVIDRLADKSLSDAALSSCISCLEVLLSLDALKPLIVFMTDDDHSVSLREQAARAIALIGSDYVQSELLALLSSPSPELRRLAGMALGEAKRE